MNANVETPSRLPIWTAAMAIWMAVYADASFAQSDGSVDSAQPLSKLSAQFPDDSLTPDEVVRVQLEALRGNGPGDQGIAICFRFASPSNKRNTGPLPRFISMMKDGVYRLMLEYRDAEYDPVEIVGNRARQRVTLISTTRAIAFVFYLSKQQHESCDGCWMTDAVAVERINSESA